ncbi:MAG: PAS domain S-box protein [Planctomycetota bacterium]|nr:MAG: PAS domain S-box protein [Planctomycetota bacterium]
MVPDAPHSSIEQPEQGDLDAALRFHGQATADLIALVDRSARLLFVNAAGERAFGGTAGRCLGRPLPDFVHPQDRRAFQAVFGRWLAAGCAAPLPVSNRIVTGAGDVRHLQWSFAPRRDVHGRVKCLIAHARDVTPQAQSAERVPGGAERQRALLAGILDPVIAIDSHGIVQEASRSVQSMFGYSPEELVGRNVALLMTEPHASQHDEHLARYRRTGETWILNRTRQFDVRRKDGAVIQCELSVSRIDVPGEGEPLFVGSFRDVGARLRAEQALAESAARMRAIFDQEFQFVGLLAPDGTLLEVNASALHAIGATRQQVIGRPFWATPWWGSPQLSERLRAAVASAAAGEFVRFEIEHAEPSGAARWMDFSLKPVRGPGGDVQFLLPEGRDITRVKEAHARELSMQQALAAIGESASVLVHEIKNPLTAVNLALRVVARQLGEDQRAVLEDLAARLRKLERTMRRTLSFARPLALEREACDLRALARDVAAALAPGLAGARVALEIVSPADLPPVSADGELIAQVLTNLVHNAREAAGEGARVRISIERENERHVRLQVEDNGPGILPSVRAQLFKPFVTSKSEGTGLGLAIARKIVLEHGGEIGVGDSSLGGACFWIRLPLEAERRTDSAPAP